MSQVIFSTQIRKYSGGGNSPSKFRAKRSEETDEQYAAAKREWEANQNTSTEAAQTEAPADSESTSAASETPAQNEKAPAQESNNQTTASSEANTQTPATNAETTPVVGKFIKNGKTLEGKAALDWIDGIYNSNPKVGREAQTIINEGIGKGYTFEINGNKVWVKDADGQDITNSIFGDKYFSKTPNWSATFNTQRHRNAVSWNALLNGEFPETPTPETPKPEKTVLRRGSGWITLDKDGNYDKASAANADMKDVMMQTGWLNDTRKDRDDYYDYDKYKWNEADRNTILNQLDNIIGLNGSYENYVNGLIGRLAKGEQTAADLAFLKLWGYAPETASGTGTGESAGNEKEYVIPTDLKDRENDFNIAGVKVETDKDGNVYIYGGRYGDGTEPWSTMYDPLFEGTKYANGYVIGGKWYSHDQAMAKFPDLINDYVMAGPSSTHWNERYDIMNNSGIRFWGDRQFMNGDQYYYGDYTEYDPETIYAGNIDSYLRSNGIKGAGIRDVGGDYTINGTYYQPGMLYEMTVPGQSDNYGRHLVKYIQVGADGSVQEVDPSKLTPAQRGKRLVGNKYAIHFANRDNNGNAIYTEFRSAGNQRNAITYNPDTNQYSLLTGYKPESNLSTGIAIDPSRVEEIKQLLKETNGVWNVDNAYLTGRLNTKLEVGPWAYKSLIDTVPELEDLKNTAYDNLTSEEMARVRAAALRGGYYKQGGKINWERLEKLQTGGTLGRKSQTVIRTNVEDAKHDISEAHSLGGDDGGLTKAERLQVYSALGDLASLGVSLVGGSAGNIIGGAGGLVASSVQIAADKERQKEGADISGWDIGKRAAANYAMDIVSALPVIGDFAKASKAAKIIKTSASAFGKLFKGVAPILGAAGAANCIGVVNKIANDEKVTSEDWITLANGLSMALGGGAVVRGTVKKASALAEAGEGMSKAAMSKSAGKVKVGDTDVNVTVEEAKSFLNKKSVKETKDAIKTFLSEKTGTEITDEIVDAAFKKLGFKTNSKGGLVKKNPDARFSRLTREQGVENSSIESAKKLAAKPSFWGNYLTPWSIDSKLASSAALMTPKEVRAINNAVANREYLGREVGWTDLHEYGRKRNYDQIFADLSVKNPDLFRIKSAENTDWRFHPLTFGGTMHYSTGNIRFKPTPRKSKPRPKKVISQPTAPPSVTPAPVPSNKQGGVIPKGYNGLKIADVGDRAKINLAPLTDVSDMLMHSALLRNSYNKMRGAYSEQLDPSIVTPRVTLPAFSFGTVNSTYDRIDTALMNAKMFTPSNADAKINAQTDLSIESKKAENAGNRAAAQSQAIDTFNSERNKAETQQNNLNAQTANERNKQQRAARTQLKALSAQEIQDYAANIFSPYSQQVRQQLRDYENQVKKSEKSVALLDLQNEYDQKMKWFYRDLYREYQNDTSANKGGFMDWINKDATRQSRYQQITDSDAVKGYQANVKRSRLDIDKDSISNPFIVYWKKGGKTSTRQRSVEELLAVQGDKSAKQAVRETSRSLMQMLQQLMKN